MTPVEPTIITAHHLRVRTGQPGFVVIETVDHEPRVSFLFDRDQALDVADEIVAFAHGATRKTATSPKETQR